MDKILKVAVIGLDTSHAMEFPKRLQDPACPEDRKVSGLRATRCLSFLTPFTDAAELAESEAYMRSIGVEVTDDFEYAVGDCDGIMIEINDPSLHLEYFKKCSTLGKPVFLDKPFAATVAQAAEIYRIAKENKVRLFTSSALRFDSTFAEGLKGCEFEPTSAIIYGPYGSKLDYSLVWYGCHSFEMLEAVMGKGAVGVSVTDAPNRSVCVVDYRDGRHCIVELNRNTGRYGVLLRDNIHGARLLQPGKTTMFYTDLLKQIVAFMNGEDILDLDDSLEVIAMLDAAARSAKSGKRECVFHN